MEEDPIQISYYKSQYHSLSPPLNLEIFCLGGSHIFPSPTFCTVPVLILTFGALIVAAGKVMAADIALRATHLSLH